MMDLPLADHALSNNCDQPFPTTPGCFVGTLSEWNPRTEQTTNPLLIYSHEEIYIGRDSRRCQYIIENPFISNKHLRIYTVIFDQENPLEVAPLVYAQDLSMNGTLWNGYQMGKGSGSFLLSNGDTLRLSPDVYLQFQCERHKEESYFDMLQRIEMKEFMDQYVVTQRMLGSGAYGQVHMAFNKETGQQLACKIVDLRAVRDRAIEQVEEEHSKFFMQPCGSTTNKKAMNAKIVAIREMKDKKIQEKLNIYNREAKVLETLCHPNIISVEKVIKSSNTIYLFQDLVTAGDLFSFIQYKGGKLGDIESAVIVRQVLMALDYLHDREIVHRDLKPDNILMTSLADGCRVVLTDFGCARPVKPTIERMSTMVGTFEYSAPEVLKSDKRGYTKAVDLWSIGCVTVVLLTGDSAFKDPVTCSYSVELAQKGDLDKLETDMDWNKVGKRAKDFVRKLLILDETKRMDVKHALRHSWFTNPAHRREFEALYERSIKDWKPRVHKGPLVVDLSSFIKASESPKSEQSQYEQDRRLDSSEVDVEQTSQTYDVASLTASTSSVSTSSIILGNCMSRCRTRFSPTLSDPELPPHHRIENRMRDTPESLQEEQSSASGSSFQDQIPSSTEAWTNDSKAVKSGLKKAQKIEQGDQPKPVSPRLPAVHHHEHLWPTEYESFDQRTINHGTGGECSKSNAWDDEFEDEVYEEVSNSITGQRQHIIYGAGMF